jgi:very-short-patch-repair endonuclease
VPSSSEFPPDWAVARRQLLRDRGISNERIRTAVRAGRWQEPVRGVVVPHSGPLTQRERWLVALTFAGTDACLSHRSALRLWGAKAEELAAARRVAGVLGEFRTPEDGGMVEVSRAHGQHMASHGFVVVHQTRRPLRAVELAGLRCAEAARAAIDVALTAPRRGDVDHVIADVLQKGLATVAELAEETRLAGRLATPWLRTAVADAGRGMRSVGESDLRRVVLAAGLPEPEWNAPIETAAGTFYVDALWRSRRVAAEADGLAYHLSARDWTADLRRQNAIHGAGVVLLRFPVRRLRSEQAACGEEMWRLVA